MYRFISLSLFTWLLVAQVPTVPNSNGATFRTNINTSLSWLDTNKQASDADLTTIGAFLKTDNAIMLANGTAWGLVVLPSCSDATTSKLLYNSTTHVFSCGTDQTAAGSTGNMVNTGASTANALPKYSDTSGTALAPSGVTIDASNNVTVPGNLTVNGTIIAGSSGAVDLTAITAPATPAAGIGSVYVDSTSKNLAVKDDAGTVKHGVQTATCTNQLASAISDAGAVTCATVTQAMSEAALKRIGLGVAVGDPAGTALSTGVLGYIVSPKACTIVGWDILVDAGTATVDVWKVASGTDIPTDAASITASAVPAIASGTALHSTTLTGWTTSVAAYDRIGFNLDAVATAKFINVTVWCE